MTPTLFFIVSPFSIHSNVNIFHCQTVFLTSANIWPAFGRAGRRKDRRRGEANPALNSKCSDSSTPNGEERLSAIRVKVSVLFGLSCLYHWPRKQAYLIGHLSQDLISEAGIGKSSLDDVVPEQILLSPIQVGITHKS